MTSLKVLDKKHFPPYKAFYSFLTKVNVLEKERNKYERYLWVGNTKSESLKAVGLKEPPKTGCENYSFLLDQWKEQKMKTLKDFLLWYLCYDLIPWKGAFKNMISFHFDNQIDLLVKHASLPLMTLSLLFQSIPFDKRRPFLYYDDEHHKLIKGNVLGGLSIIGTRWFDCMGNKPSRIKNHK